MPEGGVVTIMHADVEGSTALTTRLGDEVGSRVRDETKRIVREVVEAHGGREVDAVGDAMMLTFASTRGAIAAAVAVQNALAEQVREHPGETLRVRLGLNVGEVLDRDGDPAGAAVNAGARVMAKAQGGQILISGLVRELAGTVPGVAFRDRGRHAFKGWDEKWHLFEVDWRRPAPPPKPKPTRKRPSRRALLLAVGLLVAAVAAAAAAFALTRPDPGLPGIEPNHVGLIEPATGKIVEQIPVGRRPLALAAEGGTLWVANHDDNTITRIDERTGERTTIPVGGHPTALAADRRGVWVLQSADGRLVRVEKQFDRAGEAVAVEGDGLALLDGELWITSGATTLQRLDGSGRPNGDPVIPDRGASGLVALGSTLWVAGYSAVTPVDVGPRSTIPSAPIDLGRAPTSLAVGEGFVWAVVPGLSTGVLQKIDPGERQVAGFGRAGAGAAAVAVVGGSVWVGNSSDRTLSRFRVGDLTQAEAVPVGGRPSALAVGERGLWVAAT